MSFLEGVLALVARLQDIPTITPSAATFSDGRQRAVVKDGYRVHDLPVRKACAAAHAFGDLDSLAGWLKKHSDPAKAQVLIGAKEVRAGVDPRDPSADVPTMPWKTHPLLQPWVDATKRTLTSAELFQLVREQKASVSGDATKILTGLHSTDVVNNDTVKVQLDPATGSVIASGSVGETAVQGSVPPELTIKTPRFLGIRSRYGTEFLVAQRVLLRWTYKKGEGLEFTLTLPDLEVATLEALNEAARVLRDALPDHLICVGDYAVTTHDALPPLAPHLRADRTADWPPVGGFGFEVAFVDDDSDDIPNSAVAAAPPSEPSE